MLFSLQDFVDFYNIAVSQFLNFILGAAIIIFRDRLILEEFFEAFVGIAAQVTHRHLGLLTLPLDEVGHFFAPLF